MNRRLNPITTTLALLCLSGRLLAAENVAPRATVTASSEHSASLAATYVADGKVPAPLSKDEKNQAWAAGKNESQAALTFAWPEPVTTSTLTPSSDAASSIACTMLPIISGLNELRLSGRFSVIVATAASLE